jgi:hypothetical protein
VELNDLAGLRLPVRKEIADIDIGFQLGLFVVSQIAFIGADIRFGNPNGIVLRKNRVPGCSRGERELFRTPANQTPSGEHPRGVWSETQT